MLVAVSEGQSWRYEVLVQSDGFLVQVRDLDTGEVSPEEMTLFRTAPAALAYADMAAAADRYASARLDDDAIDELARDFEDESRHFAAVRARLVDEGIGADVLSSHQGQDEALARQRYH